MSTNWNDIVYPGPGAYPENFHDPEIIDPEGLAAALGDEDEGDQEGASDMYDEDSDYIGEDAASLDASGSEHWYSPPPHTAEAVYVEDEDDEGPGDIEEEGDGSEGDAAAPAAELVTPTSLDFVLDPSGELRMRLCVNGQCYTKTCSLELSRMVATAKRLSDKAERGELTAGDLMGAASLIGDDKVLKGGALTRNQALNDRQRAAGYVWVPSMGSGTYTTIMPDGSKKVMTYKSFYNYDPRGGFDNYGHWELGRKAVQASQGPYSQMAGAQRDMMMAQQQLERAQQLAMMQQQAQYMKQQVADWQAQQSGADAAYAATSAIDPYGGYGDGGYGDPYGGYGDGY
jgi:hypothetical protein